MKANLLPLLLLILTGFTVPFARATDPVPSKVTLAKRVEAWLDKDRIIAIQEVTRVPSDFPELTDGPCFEIGGERFNEGQLEIVASHISWEGDWHSIQVWDALLESPQVHIRCIAAHCLLIIHRIQHHPRRLVGFNCFMEPQTDLGLAERQKFRKQLAAAKLKYEKAANDAEKEKD